ANGGTNIQAGMRTARVLMQNTNADIKTIILLSDGDPTLSSAINNLDTETDLVPFGHNEQFKETKRGIDLNKYSTNTLAGDGSTSFRSRCLYNSENDDNCDNKKSYCFNYASTALTESDAAKTGSKAAVVYTVALELTGDAGTFMKDMASTPDHAFATNSNDVDDVYARIAGGISNIVSEGVIYDPIAPGFELVGDVTISRGTSTVNNGLITWTIGQPNSDYF
ncbi:MAG TPA: hypothetical protein VJY11_00940, partial [Erysipelothrix sp.]|nr:hypothetical protein [Erysipelothrix sp.]